jgi:hypothetical protein
MKLKLEKPGLLALDSAFAPPNIDPRAVARLVRNYNTLVKSQATAALDAAQREVEMLDQMVEPGLFTVDRKKAEALARKARKQAETLAREQPPAAATVSGHNPNLFPPFFGTGRSGSAGGIFTTPRFTVNPAAGLISLSVAAFPLGGHISRTAGMGALTIAPSTELATASVSAFVGGTIGAFTILGYGRASAALSVSVLADRPAGFRLATGTLPLGAMSLGVTRIPLTNMTATTRLMVNAGDLLLVSCALTVTAGCGGLICSATSNMAISGTVLCLL